MQKPVHERFSVILVTETEKCVHGEGGVAKPGEAIIPVQIATNAFRQRCRRRGNNRPGRRVGKQLKNERAAHHVPLVWATIVRLRNPHTPPTAGELYSFRVRMAA